MVKGRPITFTVTRATMMMGMAVVKMARVVWGVIVTPRNTEKWHIWVPQATEHLWIAVGVGHPLCL